MAERLVLHIGTVNSGAPMLQAALRQNAALHEALGDFGYAGGSVGTPSEWHQLLEQARARPTSTAIVSQELLGFADDAGVEAFLAAAEGFRVEVVVTVRDQFDAIAAQWESFVRDQGAVGWSAYLRQVDPTRRRPEDVDGDASRTFHRALDVVPMIRRWAGHPAVATLSVVTVPPPGGVRDELWHRFCEAAGVVSTLAYLGAGHDDVPLGYASCDVLRRVNAHLQQLEPTVRRAYRLGMAPIMHGVLADLRDQEGRPRLDRRGQQLARRSNQEIREEIADHPLFGSLDDLPVPAELERAARRASEPDRQEVKRAMRAVWEHLARETGRGGSTPRGLDKSAAQIAEMAPATQAWQEAAGLEASQVRDGVPLA